MNALLECYRISNFLLFECYPIDKYLLLKLVFGLAREGDTSLCNSFANFLRTVGLWIAYFC